MANIIVARLLNEVAHVMFSIMRRRRGLTNSRVIGMFLSRVRLLTPHFKTGQSRPATGRGIAAAPYRASDLVHWRRWRPEAVPPWIVRCWVGSGHLRNSPPASISTAGECAQRNLLSMSPRAPRRAATRAKWRWAAAAPRLAQRSCLTSAPGALIHIASSRESSVRARLISPTERTSPPSSRRAISLATWSAAITSATSR